jgi:hypothetical protein
MELTYTPLDRATAIEGVYKDQFPFNPKEQNFDNFYLQIRREDVACLQLQPVNHHQYTESDLTNNEAPARKRGSR